MRVQTIIATIILSFALVNCSNGGSGGGSEGGEVTTAATTGGVSSTGSGGYKTGSTGQLVVDKGSATATEVNAQQLNLPAGIKPAGPAVNVSESKNHNAGQIVIAIPYEAEKSSGLWAALTGATDTSRIVVIYHVKNLDGTYTLGLVPNPELVFAEDLVSFTSRGPGNYQAAYLPEPVIKPIAKTVDTPVLTIEEESTLPAVTWASLTGELTASRKFKISGTISNIDVTLKRCVVIIDEDKLYPYDEAIYVSGSLSSEHVVAKDTAHDLYGRLECQDNFGRAVTSSWTEKVSVPAAKYAAVSLQLAASGAAIDSFINASEQSSTDEWLTKDYADQVEVKYTDWLSAPISYTCASSLNYSRSSHPSIADLPGEGVYWVCVKVTSVHSKISYEHTPQLTKDTIAPSVNAGVDIITNGAPTINATVIGGAVFAWSKDSGSGTVTFGSASAEDTTVTTSADGVYVLRLTVSDLAGNIASDTVQLTKDTVAPSISFVSSAEADGMVNIADKAAGGGSDLFGVSVTGATTTTFSTWVTSATTCNSSVSYASSSIPKYSSLASDFSNRKICGRAVDAANNATYAASAVISVDLSAPTVAISNISPALSVTNINTLSFDVTPATSYEYSFVNQSVPCASVSWVGPATGTTVSAPLPDGDNRLCIRSVEASGNVSALVSYDWFVDGTAPVAGNFGNVVIKDLYYSGGQGHMTYGFDAASDTITAQGALSYKFYISTNGSLDANNVAGSATEIATQTGGSGFISKTQSTMLTANGTLQYLYVLVSDGGGNKTLYNPRSFRVPESSNQAFTQISVGANFGCGLDQEGFAFCWGANTNGQLGMGSTGSAQYIPQKVAGGKRFKKISSGNSHTCALDDAGAAYCWGVNTLGQVGDGTTASPKTSPTAVTGGLKFKDIASGANFTCAIAMNGSAYCWGNNAAGNLADGTTSSRSTPAPVQIQGGATVKFGSIHTSPTISNACGISDSGDAYCWGDNGYEQIALSAAGLSITKATLISSAKKYKSATFAMGAACFLSTEGTVWCRGDNYAGMLARNGGGGPFNALAAAQKQDTSNLGNITTIVGGSYAFCAQNDRGEIFCWGNNQGTTGVMVGVASGEYDYAKQVNIGKVATQFVSNGGTTCALDAQGGVHCWGSNASSQAGANGGSSVAQTQLNFSALRAVTRFASVATGGNHSCALTGQGKAHCWGDRTNGKIGDGGAITGFAPEAVAINAGTEKFKQIAVGAQHSCALNDGGEVACWGDNTYGQLGYAGADSNTPVLLASGDRFVQLSLGEFHSCGLVANGSVKCWGLNASGQLGDGTSSNRASPVSAAGEYISVAAGKNHTCAIALDGQAKCWGDNTYYQLAKGTGSLSPVTIDGSNHFTKLSLGADHSCALRADGIPMCWGRNDSSQVGNGAAGSEVSLPYTVSGIAVVDVAAGGAHSCVVKSDNSLSCWGENGQGQLGRGNYIDQNTLGAIVGPAYAKVRSIALGGNGSCAVMMDGGSYCWGDDNLGQLGDMLSDAMQNSPSRVSEFFVP